MKIPISWIHLRSVYTRRAFSNQCFSTRLPIHRAVRIQSLNFQSKATITHNLTCQCSIRMLDVFKQCEILVSGIKGAGV